MAPEKVVVPLPLSVTPPVPVVMALPKVLLPAPVKVRVLPAPVTPPLMASVPEPRLKVVAPPRVTAPLSVAVLPAPGVAYRAPLPPAPVPVRARVLASVRAEFNCRVAPERTVVPAVPRTELLPDTCRVPALTLMPPLKPLLLPVRTRVPALNFDRLPVPLRVEAKVSRPVPVTSTTLLTESAMLPPLMVWLDADCWMMLGSAPFRVSVLPPWPTLNAPAAESKLRALT